MHGKTGEEMEKPPTNNGDPQEPVNSRDFIGSLLFFGGIGLLLFSVFAQNPSFSVSMPRFWYLHQRWWPGIAAVIAVSGYLLQHRNRSVSRQWRPSLSGQRFQRVVVYTRDECHLCDVAKDTLHRFAEWLPEIEEIDVDESSELTDLYGSSVPVVEIDGTTRFRGVIDEILLKRLIEATPPQPSRKISRPE